MPWGGDEREDDPDATEFIRELANETPTDLGEGRLGAWGWVISFVCAAVAGVQVFNLTKSLPAEPYDQSGPKLLTRNTTRRAWNATFEIMKGRIKRVAMLGVPGIGKSRNLALGLWHGVTGNLPEGFRQPEAIVYEAREGAAVFLFTKGQDGKWKAQRLPMSEWAADACPYLRDPNNWYLVDAFEEKPTNKFDAKTWLACSPERDHYSKFIKDGGCCVYIESWSKSELEAASCQIQSAPGCDMLKRYDKIGGNLRALLSAEAAFNTYVKDQKSEAKIGSTCSLPSVAAWTTKARSFSPASSPTSARTHASTRLISAAPALPRWLRTRTMTSWWSSGASKMSPRGTGSKSLSDPC